MRNQLLSLLLLSLVAASVSAKYTASSAKYTASSKREVVGLAEKSQTHDQKSDLMQRENELHQQFDGILQKMNENDDKLDSVKLDLNSQNSQLEGVKNSLMEAASQQTQYQRQIQEIEQSIQGLQQRKKELDDEFDQLAVEYENTTGELQRVQELLYVSFVSTPNRGRFNGQNKNMPIFEQRSERKNKKASLRGQVNQKVVSSIE